MNAYTLSYYTNRLLQKHTKIQERETLKCSLTIAGWIMSHIEFCYIYFLPIINIASYCLFSQRIYPTIKFS